MACAVFCGDNVVHTYSDILAAFCASRPAWRQEHGTEVVWDWAGGGSEQLDRGVSRSFSGISRWMAGNVCGVTRSEATAEEWQRRRN